MKTHIFANSHAHSIHEVLKLKFHQYSDVLLQARRKKWSKHIARTDGVRMLKSQHTAPTVKMMWTGGWGVHAHAATAYTHCLGIPNVHAPLQTQRRVPASFKVDRGMRRRRMQPLNGLHIEIGAPRGLTYVRMRHGQEVAYPWPALRCHLWHCV
jgi:hypothetical protein